MAVARLQDNGRAAHDALNGVDWLVDDEAHPHGAGEMVYEVGLCDQFIHQLRVIDGAHMQFQGAALFEAAQIIDASCGEVVKDSHPFSGGDQCRREVGPDESCPACNENIHNVLI